MSAPHMKNGYFRFNGKAGRLPRFLALALAACIGCAAALAAGSAALAQAQTPAAVIEETEAAGGMPPEQPSIEEMLGQMILVGFRGQGLNEPLHAADYRKILSCLAEGRAGGVILFNREHSGGGERNIRNPRQLEALCAELQAAAPGLLFIAVDQEGGRVRRLTAEQGFMDLPSPWAMSLLGQEKTGAIGRALGRELAGLGINVNFAPALDLNINPHNPVIGVLERSFGTDAARVAALAAAFQQGLEEAGIVAAYKHFPGHGSSSSDTHVEFTDISKSWRPAELEPYRLLLGEWGPYMVMLGHLYHRDLDRDLPASLSEKVVGKLLRGELGWQGVVISDDLQMQAVAGRHSLEETILLAVRAGNDILLFGNNLRYDPDLPDQVFETLLRLYREGKISRERVAASYDRIMRLKAWLAVSK